MKKIRLVVFNEPYWDKGLIYSQNILPLLQLVKTEEYALDVVSFTSLPFLFKSRRDIQATKDELAEYGVNVMNFPVFFYPTRFMLLKYFLLPFYFLNVFFYIKYLNGKDEKDSSNILYSIRSYQAALGFLKFYKEKNRIIFDTRTDWIEENINVGNFKANSSTVSYWKNAEKEMLLKFKKTLFISDLFRDAVLKRHSIKLDENKYCLVYNPINYKHFHSVQNHDKDNNFLYTGSLGHWNNISIYLDFFLKVADKMPSSKLIVCTGSPIHKIEPTFNLPKYDAIRNRVEIHYSVPYSELPSFYARCTYGLQLMSKKDTRVGVKFIEYIAANLIPIVNTNVMGAAALARKYEIGIVLDDETEEVDSIVNRLEQIKQNRNNCKLAEFRKITDLNEFANILKPIYS